jgi:hypothetical protein
VLEFPQAPQGAGSFAATNIWEGTIMKSLLIGGIVLGLLAPASAIAQSVFDGTWKADVNSAQMPSKPDVFLLEKGTWSCKTCVPAVTVPADGMDHAVTGHPYYDSVAIKVADDHTVQETDKKGGKVVAISTSTISSDGKTMTTDFTDSSNSNADPVKGKVTEARVGAAAPKDAHAISGSWRVSGFSGYSDNGLTVTYKVDGNSLMMMSPTGQKYTAKMDGTDSPMMGDPGVSSVSVMKMAGDKIMETDKRDGKVIGVATMTVAKDGKSMNVVYENKLQGTSMSYTSNKQ